MAIDSVNEKFAALFSGMPWLSSTVPPNGNFSKLDMVSLLGLFSPIVYGSVILRVDSQICRSVSIESKR
jgi:hypothetical protein